MAATPQYYFGMDEVPGGYPNNTLINLDVIKDSVWHDSPFFWTRYVDAINSPKLAAELRDTFPFEGFSRYARQTGSKRHRLFGRRITVPESADSAGLPSVWQVFCNEANSPPYRRALERATGMSLVRYQVEITLWRNGLGDFIDPHVDNNAKALVHLIYFSSSDWTPIDGGCLRILRSNRLDDFEQEIEPKLGTAVIFRRSAKSWHGYCPIMRGDSPRLAAQIVFHEPWMKYSDSSAALSEQQHEHS